MTPFTILKHFIKGVLLVSILVITGCSRAPTYTIEGGTRHLKRQGLQEELIQRASSLDPINEIDFDLLVNARSADVRYLLAANRHLTPDQLDALIADSDLHVRAKASSHPNITWGQAAQLYKMNSLVINRSLVANPATPSDVILAVFEEKNPGLVYFACNPNCPEEIRKIIQASRDTKAKRWLETARKATSTSI